MCFSREIGCFRHSIDSGKEDEAGELNRLHGIWYDYASAMTANARKQHTKKKYIVEGV